MTRLELRNVSEHTQAETLRLHLASQCHSLESYSSRVYPSGLKNLIFVRHNLAFHIVCIFIVFG
jgi:hypothetical protein